MLYRLVSSFFILEDTTFPYTAQSQGKGGMRGGNGERPNRGDFKDGNFPDKEDFKDGEFPDGNFPGKEDLEKKDALGNTVDYRLNMYNPMYYLSDYYDGYKTANVAKYWRIRSGINQGDTAFSTEVNLALALKNYEDTNVDFETVWGQGHVQAERTGDSSANFIAWVNACLK